MRRVALLLSLVVLAACAEKLTGPQAQVAAVAYRDQAIATAPLIFVNGVEADTAYLRKLDEKTIESVEIIKGKAALARYGERAQKGVILVKTK
jgi:TonB-dependent SusC/RagA subfamily outer membrane receptor